MPAQLRALAALAAVLFTAGGCDSPLEAGGLAGTYALVSFDNAPLPAVVIDNELGRVVILADTLRFRASGTGSRVTVSRYQPSGAGPTPAVERHESQFGYEVVGSRLEISFVCPPNALCAAGPHLTGSATGASVRLTGGAAHPRTGTFLFRNVGR